MSVGSDVILVNDTVFQGTPGPHRQGGTFSRIRIQTTTVGGAGLLLLPQVLPALDKISAVVIETDIEKIIGPG